MDTLLGTLQLTEIQKQNMAFLSNPAPFKGFSIWSDGRVIGVSDTEPTEEEKQNAVIALQGLSTEPCQELLASQFSFHVLMGRLNQTMAPASIVKLAPYTGALQSFCDWKNWVGIGAFLNSLIDAEIATVEEISQVVDAFEEQGISL